ncbi:hypothetical protein ACFQ5M_09885 [Agrilactobacillus yilanensis]|uniref:Uncharacterized protein n=1 Tax=Agrilactobacillus yilanensis TaxID=2485997 RepID=A0ABW4J9T9_9LACO|nr:hypothetical protein [Agrilactobacillus yilanensis]
MKPRQKLILEISYLFIVVGPALFVFIGDRLKFVGIVALIYVSCLGWYIFIKSN